MGRASLPAPSCVRLDYSTMGDSGMVPTWRCSGAGRDVCARALNMKSSEPEEVLLARWKCLAAAGAW